MFSERRCRKLAGNGKINHGKGMFGAAALTFPFQNTLLNKDIRNVVSNPVQKIYAVFSKMYMDEKYSVVEKMDKSLVGRKILFSEEIEKLLER